MNACVRFLCKSQKKIATSIYRVNDDGVDMLDVLINPQFLSIQFMDLWTETSCKDIVYHVNSHIKDAPHNKYKDQHNWTNKTKKHANTGATTSLTNANIEEERNRLNPNNTVLT